MTAVACPGLGRLRWIAGMSLGVALLSARGLQAQSARPNDYEVKAAYLLNFGRFATWPESATAAEGPSVSVCVIGRDPFGGALNAMLAGETISGKRVIVRRLMAANDAAGCRILFVSGSEDTQLPRILDGVSRLPVLTVGDLSDFVARGGMIQFVVHDNRIRFEVNLAAAEQAHLRLSSELLRVATTVRRIARPGP